MSKDLYEFRDVTLRFNGKTILNHFNWTVAEGDQVRIKGRSGTGKTTLFRMMLGFVHPDEGEICFKGETLSKSNIWEVRKCIGYVSQDLSLADGTVDDFLNDIRNYKSNKTLNVTRADIDNLFRGFSFGNEIYKEQINNLSGGEKQRLAIVAALMVDRPVYLLDEITSALDDDLKEKVVEYFMKLGKTLLVISHDSVWDSKDTKVLNMEEVNSLS